ncbi:hypothetical protein TanjilG_16417 [Lupinus angustifolius]|uniref:Uncharacterized protein n=1 Tax=Lupinus angustifolius TaxID=3871 RepID=A0A1J7H8B4_LUPAN|nr:PREDICTED: uncharacterized protein LOC109352793 [Lupinus angustifolius]OIW08836.1 hypothetical protein TanjilG_16417 [Lupinus angustifolius]
MSHSQPPQHDGVSKASQSHAPGTSDVALNDNREVAALPPPPPPPPPPKRITWTNEEHRLFLQGIKQYGRGNWKKISQNCLKSRTPSQIASHAQKYFLRQSSVVRKRKSIHDGTLEIVQASSPRNLVTMQQGQEDLSSHRHLNLNLNHPVIMPMQQDSTHHDHNQNHSFKTSPPQDSTHHDHNQNHSFKTSPPQDSTHENHSVTWPFNPSKHQNHLYIDMIIQKSDEGHLDIFVKDSNQVKVQSVLTVQSSPHHLDLSSQQIHIPYFFSEDHPPQKCRVMLKNFATQP